MLRKTRPILAITLLVQAMTLFFLFILQVAKRRSLAQAFLAVAAFSATGGVYLLWQEREEAKEAEENKRLAKELFSGDEEYQIPLDETASEKEFKKL